MSQVFVEPLVNGWWLKRPLPLCWEQEDSGEWLVSDDVFLRYGLGDTRAKAWLMYCETLIEYREIMAGSDNEYDAAELHRLDSYMGLR